MRLKFEITGPHHPEIRPTLVYDLSPNDMLSGIQSVEWEFDQKIGHTVAKLTMVCVDVSGVNMLDESGKKWRVESDHTSVEIYNDKGESVAGEYSKVGFVGSCEKPSVLTLEPITK